MGMHPVNIADDRSILWDLLFDDNRDKLLGEMCDLGLLHPSLLNEWRIFLAPLSPNSREWANVLDQIFIKTSVLLEKNSYLSPKSPRDIVSNFLKAASVFDVNAHSFDDLRGKIFLDVGSGIYRSFNVSMIMYCNGVDEAYAFEPYPLQVDFVYHSFLKMIESMSNSPESFIFSGISVDEFMSRLKTFVVPGLHSKIKKINDNSNYILNIGGITFFKNLKDIPTGSANIHFSNAVLEHIGDIAGFMDDLRGVVAADSVGLHIVDFLDHRHYNNPNISPVEKYFDNYLDEINGYTPSELESLFLSANWSFDKFEALKIPEKFILNDSRKLVDRYSGHALNDLTQHLNFYKMISPA